MKKRIKVYVAGPYSGDNVLSVLQNIGYGQKVCADLFKMGFAPFCPWHDKSFVMDNPDMLFDINDFYEYSIAWLKVSDIILVIDGWEDSKGTKAKIKLADELEIPVCYSIDELVKHCAYFNPGQGG